MTIILFHLFCLFYRTLNLSKFLALNFWLMERFLVFLGNANFS